MKLRKQLFTSFLTVALLPLMVVGIYMFVTNVLLALDLHEQNLTNSIAIQADLVEDNINRLMVRARQFVSAREVRDACREGAGRKNDTLENLTAAILNFTDETLDSVAVFALLDAEGQFLYISGSKSDSLDLQSNLTVPLHGDRQVVMEIAYSGEKSSLMIYTPVQDDGKIVGSFLAVCSTEHFLKMMSGHRQMESSNTLIYCQGHGWVVTSKQDAEALLWELDAELEQKAQGSLIGRTDGKMALVCYQSLSKAPWVLVGTVEMGQVFSRVWLYGLLSSVVLTAVLVIILFLSRRQSRKILYPMDQLLHAVETFFLGEENRFPKMDIDSKTEIGYLVEKFTKLSEESAQVQSKLRESDYLYQALLQATFEFRIAVDFQAQTAECTLPYLTQLLKSMPDQTVSRKLLTFLAREDGEESLQSELVRAVNGEIHEPIDTEIYFDSETGGGKKWYRIVAVPVVEGGGVSRVVLHFEDITEQKREELRLIQSSQTDALSGFLHKAAFLLHCKISADGKPDALFFIDLDYFKQVNDTLGHAAGDSVLVATAKAIRAQFRASDVIGRFGGDEFVVFAPHMSKEMAAEKAQGLLDAISFYPEADNYADIHVTASVGVCMAAPALTLEQAIQCADEAMYRAKENGRSQFYLIDYKQE